MTHVSLSVTHTHAQPGGEKKKSVHLFCWVTNMTSDAMLAGSRPIVKVISLIKEVLIIPQLFRTWLSETLTLPTAQEPHLICPSCVILCISLSFHVQHAISTKNEKITTAKVESQISLCFSTDELMQQQTNPRHHKHENRWLI